MVLSLETHKTMNKNTEKPNNKIQINNILLSEKLEIGRFYSDDVSLFNRLTNVLDKTAYNFDIIDGNYVVNSTVGIAPNMAIKMNTRLSDNNINVARNSDDYVKGNIANNFYKYPSVTNDNLDFVSEGNSIHRTFIINRGVLVYLSEAKGTDKEKSISIIHFIYEGLIGANASLLNEVKPNVNGALNLKDTEKVFITKGFKIDPKVERHNRRGYLPSLINIKNSVTSEVYAMYENIYKYFKTDFDKLIADSIEFVANISADNTSSKPKASEKTPKAYMVQLSGKKWQYMTADKVKSIEATEPTLTKLPLGEWAKLLADDTKVTLSKKLNDPKASKVKNPNAVVNTDDQQDQVVKNIVDASNNKNTMVNGEQVLSTKNSTK
jgi:hypothetical protein